MTDRRTGGRTEELGILVSGLDDYTDDDHDDDDDDDDDDDSINRGWPGM